jgi:hypothetical protein
MWMSALDDPGSKQFPPPPSRPLYPLTTGPEFRSYSPKSRFGSGMARKQEPEVDPAFLRCRSRRCAKAQTLNRQGRVAQNTSTAFAGLRVNRLMYSSTRSEVDGELVGYTTVPRLLLIAS